MEVDELLWKEANQPETIEVHVDTQTAVKREESWRGPLHDALYRLYMGEAQASP
jgi:hypothetical protein